MTASQHGGPAVVVATLLAALAAVRYGWPPLHGLGVAGWFVAAVMALQIGASVSYAWDGNFRQALIWSCYAVVNWAITPWGTR